MASAPTATGKPIVLHPRVTADTLQQLSATTTVRQGKPNVGSGSGGGSPAPDDSYLLPSMNSGGNASDWRGFWKQPKTVKDLAAQAAVVCTKLLNGQLDLASAQAYSSVLRSVAALVHSSVMKAKMDEKPPDLSLDSDPFEDPSLSQTHGPRG